MNGVITESALGSFAAVAFMLAKLCQELLHEEMVPGPPTHPTSCLGWSFGDAAGWSGMDRHGQLNHGSVPVLGLKLSSGGLWIHWHGCISGRKLDRVGLLIP